MNKDLIPFELADELKELGFTGGEGRYYVQDLGMCERILCQQAFRWFRENHFLDSYIISTYIDLTNQKNNEYTFAYQSSDDYDYFINDYRYTYQEAELACLKRLIEIVKNK